MRRIIRVYRYGKGVIARHGFRETCKMAANLLGSFGFIGMIQALRYRASGGMSMQREKPEKLHLSGWLYPHLSPVDIIVCVHNALADVKACLDSVILHTLPPYKLIIVDDGSEAETRDYLKEFAKTQGAVLIRNEQAGGYTRAANKGLAESHAAWSLLLNSDTIVTPYWLDRMVAAGETSNRVGLVGPLSNAASWQSVPGVMREDGDWEENPLPEGMTLDEWAQEIASISPRFYPRVGFLNGFCLMIRRELRKAIGDFDEETFGAGYGEENDYCLRALKAGRELVVADDAFVWHTQSRSYSHEKRLALCERADKALHGKHGSEAIFAGLRMTERNPALEGFRARIRLMEERRTLKAETQRMYEGKRVFFLLPAVEAGGGGNVIVREAQAMSEMGVDAEIVNLSLNGAGFEKNYPQCRVPVRYIPDPAELARLAPQADVLVATLFTTVDWMAQFVEPLKNKPTMAYYVQDFEPYFFPEDDPRYRQAWEGYTKIKGMKLVCKSEWNRRELLEKTGAQASVIGPSYGWEMYYPFAPKSREGEKVRVIAMVRPSTPRRAPELTMRVLSRLKKKLGSRVDITIFGCSARDKGFRVLEHDFPHRNAGAVTSEEVAKLLAGSDVFLDFSTYQAMGLTALEAMASEVAVVAPKDGGSGEFIRDGVNGLLVDTADEEACLQAAERLVSDHALRSAIQKQALRSAVQYYPEKSARALLDAVFEQAEEKQEARHASACAV